MAQALLAALDSGGTKTVCLVAGADGTVLGAGSGGPGNTNFVSRAVAASSFARAAKGAIRAAGLDGRRPVPVVAWYAGVPGAPLQLVEEALAPFFRTERRTVAGDTLSAFLGALTERYGVVALAGTGSFAAGFDRRGRSVTLGGWGSLLGDEGSGYAIGLQALQAAVRASEGRGPATRLTGLLVEAWELHDFRRDLVELVYRRSQTRRRIAALTPVVAEAAREGDGVARAILRRAGRDLGELAAHAVRQLDLQETGCPVALTGGVAAAGPEVRRAFAAAVRTADPACRVVPPRFSPAVGALLLACESAGLPVGAEVLANLEASAERFPGLKGVG